MTSGKFWQFLTIFHICLALIPWAVCCVIKKYPTLPPSLCVTSFMIVPLKVSEAGVHICKQVQWGLEYPNIWIQNPFKIKMFLGSDLGWFGFRMIGTIATAIVATIQKWNQYIGIWDGGYWIRFRMVRLFLEYYSKSEPCLKLSFIPNITL